MSASDSSRAETLPPESLLLDELKAYVTVHPVKALALAFLSGWLLRRFVL